MLGNHPFFDHVDISIMKQLEFFIKNIYHKSFEFIDIDKNFIGYSNGIYNLSNCEFIEEENINFNIQTRVYLNHKFEIKETPLFDSYLHFQFGEEEDYEKIKEIIYFYIGRCLTKINIYDNFKFMLWIQGISNSGKSLLSELINYCYGDSVHYLNKAHQESFGFSEIIK